MADFLMAMRWIREGKKVRRYGWDKGCFWAHEYGKLYCNKTDSLNCSIENFGAEDWEIFEEKKTLSDEIFIDSWDYPCIYVTKVKKAIDKLKEKLDDWNVDKNVQKGVLNEIFGTKLTEEKQNDKI